MNKLSLMSIAFIAIAMSTAFGILSDNGKAGYKSSQGELNCDDYHYINGNEINDSEFNNSKVVSQASATGILEQSKTISEFKSYVNSESRIAIEFQSATAEQPRINLYDMEGRMISSQLIDSHSIGEVKSSISIPAELKSGSYIVSILSNNHKLSSKIFIP